MFDNTTAFDSNFDLSFPNDFLKTPPLETVKLAPGKVCQSQHYRYTTRIFIRNLAQDLALKAS